MITVEHLEKKFDQLTVLKDINVRISKGEVIAIIGPSGTGKSTFLRCLNLLERPTGGTMVIDDVDMLDKNTDVPKMRQKMGMVFQSFNLFHHLTVLENLTIGPVKLRGIANEAAEARGMELLKMVGLAEKAHSFADELSGGQKQRVAIARALASNPKVLLCDEATSALDPATTRSILELLKDINRRLGLTILLITHEMDVVKRICDQVAVISQGQLIEKDSVSEVFSHPKTPLAQQFIQSTLHLDIPDDYAARLSPERQGDRQPLLRLEFTGQSVDAPLLSEAARRFNVNNNIISAQMDYAGGVKFGVMLAELHGSDEDALATIKFLQENQVKVEVLGYV